MHEGIVAYGVSLPYHRLAVDQINEVWLNSNYGGVKGLQVSERGVVGADEDLITYAAEAGGRALAMAGVPASKIGACLVGTHTGPYASRAAASVVAEMLALGPLLYCGDVQFSGKSGTTAMQMVLALIRAGMIEYGLAIGGDVLGLHTPPGDVAEYTAGAGAAAFLLGTEGVLATIDGVASYTTDTPDAFRISGARYVTTGGSAMTASDVGQPTHTQGAVRALLDQVKAEPKEFQHAVFQQSSGSTSARIGRLLGFAPPQWKVGMVADCLGDMGSASALVGLARVLDQARAGERLLVASYGFGASSDALALTTTERVALPKRPATVDALIARKRMVDYGTSVKFERKYQQPSLRMSAFE
jgi:hydroxymethylglutaryl-CoA synthase